MHGARRLPARLLACLSRWLQNVGGLDVVFAVTVAGIFAVIFSGSGCKSSTDTVLVVNVGLQSPIPATPIVGLRVTVRSGTSRAVHDFPNDRSQPLNFPSDFSLQMSGKVASPLRLDIVAHGNDGSELASLSVERIDVVAGRRTNLTLELTCLVDCIGDGGVSDAARLDATPSDVVQGPKDPPACGNSRLDDGEICDPGIWAGRPGACPPANCDDKVACTVDLSVGAGCQLTCEHDVINEARAGDACCPADGTAATDPDCSSTCGNGVREPNETCDTQAPANSPFACPTEASCEDDNPCTADKLISANTCAAQCVRHAITAALSGDGCCPAGAVAAFDNDCPAVCGNWQKDPGERCDRAQPSSGAAGCATTCKPAGNDACVMTTLVGAGCGVHCTSTRITLAVPGDRCCPEGASRNVDGDCPTICGNGLLEPGEACDSRIAPGLPGACPQGCAPSTGMCLATRLEGRADDCSARCTTEPVLLCSPVADGCCPSGCTPTQDADCMAACGNGTVEPGEMCDTAIAIGTPGACPAPLCTDADACTTDRLLSAGTCHARCAHIPVTHFITGDGCCPPGGHNLLDSDCPAACGNRIVESPQETCDRALPDNSTGRCMTTCPTLPSGCSRFALQGAPETCSSRCVLETVTACISQDGCCAPGCTHASDSDCAAICGNKVIEVGETCDVGLSAGTPGACEALCNDGNTCTADVTLGRRIDCTRVCRFDPITVCQTGDRCCPAGCTTESDADCAPAMCGNRIVEATELCDPPNSCPTRCPDDGDACTSELLVGDAKTCNARCESAPIRSCSGATKDACCPTGCVARTDADCESPAPQPPLL